MYKGVGYRVIMFLAVAASPGKAQVAAPSAQVPVGVYERLFREVVSNETRADRLSAKGEPDASIRHHHQLWLGLTSDQESLLKQVASDWSHWTHKPQPPERP
jgi:hypothetical protein